MTATWYLKLLRQVLLCLLLCPLLPASGASALSGNFELSAKVGETNGISIIEYWSGNTLVGRSTEKAPAGVEIRLPGAKEVPVVFPSHAFRDGGIDLGPAKVGGLTLRLRLVQKTPFLVERVLEVRAEAAQQFAITFPLDLALEGEYATFSGPEQARTLFDTVRGSPRLETFPVAMVRTAEAVFGLAADSPGLWENRCQVLVDAPAHRLAILTGDGRDPYPLVIKPPEDARDTYQYQMDGWQSLAAGETRRFTTWVFASPAHTHYDAQVAAHLAVANGKGWNSSLIEAILRNTSLYLLRRNLALDANNQPRDGRYIFISGPGYGWKQWVSDGFYTALGLDDPEKTIESNRSVFWTRMDYEDNAQYYLIWAVLMKRAGGTVNEPLVRRAYDFLRRNETNGMYLPPPLPGAPNAKGWKTYHDVLPYDDDDCPASNQGFHCGALLAARELGLDVTEQDITSAVEAYRSLFNVERGFMPTSRKLHDTLGQDTLYGATLTYAVFGLKLLTDDQVLSHVRTSEKVKTPYGLRVISQADGSLLPDHSGVYCYGGSWFLNDAANYLLAGVHGLPAAEVDALLAERIAREIAFVPAFNESISTVTGKPHGHVLYSWNSGYWWLRREIRKHLGQTGPDPVDVAIDRRFGVIREHGALRLEPAKATNAEAAPVTLVPAGTPSGARIGSLPADRILFLGNSITLHGPLPSIGWSGNWGMAASAEEKDYVHLLTAEIARASQATPSTRVKNLAEFERQYETFDGASNLTSEFGFNADIIIIAVGENVPALDSDAAKAKYAAAFARLLAQLKQRGHPSIFVRSCFWPDPSKDEIMKQASAAAGATFIDIAALGRDEANAARSERKIEHAGVAAHPGDKGMKAIADAIWAAIQQRSTQSADVARLDRLLGYTVLQTDLPGGRHANVRTMRAALIRADGSGKRLVAAALADQPDAWTQFAGWSPDGAQAIIYRGWQSPENAKWEEEHKTFRFTNESWRLDSYLVNLASGKAENVTDVERVSFYNSGLFYWPNDPSKLGFTALIDGNSHPFRMDRDGRNKVDLTKDSKEFSYGFTSSRDGKRISYHKNYHVFLADADGTHAAEVKTGQPFNFGPSWSPDGQWVLFLSGEHHNCHPHLVRADGTGLQKLADRGGYPGSIEFLDVPDFHEGSSDVPNWSADGKTVFYTARVGKSVELFQVSLDGKTELLTKSPEGTLHYHPEPSPDGQWLAYGSKRDGVRQLYVMRLADRTEQRITDLKPGQAAMWPHWQP
jgi:Tol biopolymer transport system component